MRNRSFFITLCCMAVLTAASFTACKQKTAPQTGDTVTLTAQTSSQTVNGKVIDATMNNIMLLTEKGDTLHISTMDADPEKVPGVLLEDKVQITCVTEKVNGQDILKAIELTVTEPGLYRDK